jgi:hypothetical protein
MGLQELPRPGHVMFSLAQAIWRSPCKFGGFMVTSCRQQCTCLRTLVHAHELTTYSYSMSDPATAGYFVEVQLILFLLCQRAQIVVRCVALATACR